MKRVIFILLVTLSVSLGTNAWGQETQKDVGNRLRGEAQRAQNAGNSAKERTYERAAARADKARTVEKARQIERDTNKGR